MKEEYMPIDWDTKGSVIKVIGVGGGGSNAVSNMYRTGIKDVDFVVCNTDAQALEATPVHIKVRLGASLTRGRGAGCNPEQGKQAAEQSLTDIKNLLSDSTEMIFITAGMGGGTGTGAAPVIAQVARELGLLTVAIVTIPFRDEGSDFMKRAREGITELQRHVDSLLVIDNERLYEIYGEIPLKKALLKSDEVLTTAAKGIADIITHHGYINVDFEDVKKVMTQSGVAMMGSGSASGAGRALAAVEAALSSPLLNHSDISGAKNVLVNITANEDTFMMSELSQIMNTVKERTGGDPEFIKRGVVFDCSLGDTINVTVVATGFNVLPIPDVVALQMPEVERVVLHEFSEDPVVNDIAGENNPVQEDMFEVKDNVRVFSIEDEPAPAPAVAPVRTATPTPAPMPTRQRQKPVLILEKDDDITQLENVPAYLRKNKQVNVPENNIVDSQATTMRIVQTPTGGHRLSAEKNSYLNPEVD